MAAPFPRSAARVAAGGARAAGARAPRAPGRGRIGGGRAQGGNGNGAGEANRRADIVRVAARLFREQGYDGTTVRDIAGAVGMRSGSPFYHFANKEEILYAVMEEGLRQGLARSEAALARHGGARDRFVALMRAHFGTILEDGHDFVPVMLYEWRRLPAAYRKRLIAVKDRYDTLWQRAIDALIAAGLVRGDPKLARLMILGAVNFTATWYRRSGPLSIDALAHDAAEFFLQPAAEPRARRRNAA